MTATQVDREGMEQAQAYGALSKFGPAYQAEVIAKHYLAYATMAKQLHLVVEMYQRNPGPILESAINFLVERIKQGHLADFGIPLEWPTKYQPI